MSDEKKSTSKPVDLDVARNKKRNKEGRLKNLATMFVNREIERGPFYANMWLYQQIGEADNLNEAFKELKPYIEEARKELYV